MKNSGLGLKVKGVGFREISWISRGIRVERNSQFGL